MHKLVRKFSARKLSTVCAPTESNPWKNRVTPFHPQKSFVNERNINHHVFIAGYTSLPKYAKISENLADQHNTKNYDYLRHVEMNIGSRNYTDTCIGYVLCENAEFDIDELIELENEFSLDLLHCQSKEHYSVGLLSPTNVLDPDFMKCVQNVGLIQILRISLKNGLDKA